MTTDRDPRPRRRSRHGVADRTWLLGLLGLAAVAPLAGCGSSVPAAAADVGADHLSTVTLHCPRKEHVMHHHVHPQHLLMLHHRRHRELLVAASTRQQGLRSRLRHRAERRGERHTRTQTSETCRPLGDPAHWDATCPVPAHRVVWALASSDSLVHGGGRSR
jgi:hypothetical protein